MIIQMTINMSGGRYDDQRWPPAWTDFEVPDEEGRALIRDRNAVFIRDSAVAPVPVLPPPVEKPRSQPAHTARGPVFAPGPGPDGPVHTPAPEAEKPVQPKPSDTKRAWEDYAVASGMDPDDAVDSSKAELMSTYGGRL